MAGPGAAAAARTEHPSRRPGRRDPPTRAPIGRDGQSPHPPSRIGQRARHSADSRQWGGGGAGPHADMQMYPPPAGESAGWRREAATTQL